jgi:hypothetical protein
VTVSSAFIDMFENWLYWYQLLALDMPIILIAEDQETFQKYESNGILDTRLSKFFVFQDNVTFDYDSKNYKDLVSKRPSHMLEVFKSHENIIYTDVDTVWLEDPRPYFSGDHDLWLSLDFEPDLNDFDPALLSFFEFCTGFMALLPTNGTMSILQEWELELVKKPQLNQPVFNHLLTKFKLSIGMLDRVRFPSGDIFFGEKNISTSILPASPLPVNVNKTDHAVVVHNNWIRGHANKVQRFKHKGLWWKDLPSYALSGTAFSRNKSNDSIATTSSGRDMLKSRSFGSGDRASKYCAGVACEIYTHTPDTLWSLLSSLSKVATEQHGLDHPAVAIDVPSLECACADSNASSISSDREQDGDQSSRGGTCRTGGQASWVFAVRGLVPGFSYRLHFKWSLADEQLGAFHSVISTATSSYVARKPLTESGQNGTSTFDVIALSRKLRMDVAVWDIYPGLKEEETLIGARLMDSAVNTVRILCTDLESNRIEENEFDFWEPSKVPDGEDDGWSVDLQDPIRMILNNSSEEW